MNVNNQICENNITHNLNSINPTFITVSISNYLAK